MSHRYLLTLVGLPVSAVFWTCTPFHGTDLSEDSGAISTNGPDSGIYTVPVDGGPAASCALPGTTGNAAIIASPTKARVNETIKVQVTLLVGSNQLLSDGSLRLCGPQGLIGPLKGSETVTAGGGNTPSQYVWEYVVQGGVPTAGVTQIVFAKPGEPFFGTTLITITP